MRIYLLSAVALLAFAGCQKAADSPSPAPSQMASAAPSAAPTTPATPSEPLDPFVVSVDAQRWGVLISKARDGVREAPTPPGAPEDTDLFRADRSLKNSAAELLQLRNDACMRGLATGAACTLGEWPAWTLEPPSPNTPIEEIDRRSQWLSTQMSALTEIGCDAGRKTDEMFCSVE